MISLFTCKVASGSATITLRMLNNLLIKQGCGAGRYIELHVQSGHQHKQAYLLYSCAFIHRRIYPRLVHVSDLVVFKNINCLINFFFLFDVILTTFLIILSIWLYKLFFFSQG